MGAIPRGAFVALRTDMYKDWDSNPERLSVNHSLPGHSRPSNISTNSAAQSPPDTRSMDTDTTDKMLSETYILQTATIRSR